MLDKKILIVDDEGTLAEILTRCLKSKGFKNVLMTVKADEAMARIKEEKPDLIFLDVELKAPINGVEILKRTKQVLSPQSMVIMISGNKELHEKNCKKLGAYDFWQKPIYPEIMLTGIKNMFLELESKQGGKGKMAKIKVGNDHVAALEPEKLSFYDVKTKAKFETDHYQVREKNGRFFAVAKSLKGPHECWRVLSKEQAVLLKAKR